MSVTSAVRLALLSPVLCIPLGSASAQDSDLRIVDVSYLPDSVYPITIEPGLATVVEFQRDESVESVVVGNGLNWLVETTASANRVVIKPNVGANPTNMIVVTTKRTYTFTLEAGGGHNTFLLRFDYSLVTASDQVSYRFRGDKELFPRLMTDNGRTTSIYWSSDAELPAVFVVNREGDEVAVSYRATGDGLIVEGVHDEYVFRFGKAKATGTRYLSKDRRR